MDETAPDVVRVAHLICVTGERFCEVDDDRVVPAHLADVEVEPGVGESLECDRCRRRQRAAPLTG